MVKVALPETTWLEVGDIFVDEDKIKNFENLVISKKLIGSLIFRMLKKMCFVYNQKIFNLKHQAFKVTPNL